MYPDYMNLRHLNIITWEDESGKVREFYLTKKIAARKRFIIGVLLELPYSMLESLDIEYRHRQEKYCQMVLKYWLDNSSSGLSCHMARTD